MDFNTRAQEDSRYRAARFNEKECLQVWAGDDALREELFTVLGWRYSNRVSENTCTLIQPLTYSPPPLCTTFFNLL
jgi:hypothetical protein